MFEVGEKVICVDTKPYKEDWDIPNISEGVVYTIKDIQPDELHYTSNLTVWLEEIGNWWSESSDDPIDIGYFAFRFRKLIKKKQSIEVFHSIRKKVEEDVRFYTEQPFV